MSKKPVPEDSSHAGSNPNTYPQNGREYGRGYDYLFPYDQLEMDEQGLLHNTVINRIGGKAFTADVPLRKKDGPPKASSNGDPPPAGYQVLDLGTGTGLWAMMMAEQYRDVQIFAVDLFDFQHPRQIFRNTWFSGHIDIEQSWERLYGFLDWAVESERRKGFRDFSLSRTNWDLIYARALNGSIRDRRQLYRRIFEHLTPGSGYVELVEIDWTPQYDDTARPEKSYFAEWAGELHKAMEKAGRDMRIDPNTTNILRELGFVDVKEEKKKLYHNPWCIGGDDETVGRWFNLTLTYGLEGMSMAPFTRYLGWTPEQVTKYLDRVRNEICLLRYHGYCTLHIWRAKRPSR